MRTYHENLESDSKFCGFNWLCGNGFSCSDPNTSEKEIFSCSADTDPMTSQLFCGASMYCEDETCTSFLCTDFTSCTFEQQCVQGHCVGLNQTTSCTDDNQVLCHGTCIYPMTSNTYCGADENCQNYKTCTGNQTCSQGDCVTPNDQVTCLAAGQVKCGNQCIYPMTSNTYCGADENCQNYKTCTGNQTCSQGDCVTPNDQVTCLTDQHCCPTTF